MNRRMILPLLLLLTIGASAQTQNATRAPNYPQPVEGDFVIRDFKFDSGETLPELKLHYRTVGELKRDASGRRQQRRSYPARHGRLGRRLSFEPVRRRALRLRTVPRRDEVFHHPARRRRPRPIVEAQQRIARAISALRL